MATARSSLVQRESLVVWPFGRKKNLKYLRGERRRAKCTEFGRYLKKKNKRNIALYFQTRLQTIPREPYIEPFLFVSTSFAPSSSSLYSSPPIEITK